MVKDDHSILLILYVSGPARVNKLTWHSLGSKSNFLKEIAWLSEIGNHPWSNKLNPVSEDLLSNHDNQEPNVVTT